jgi:hypothetical protein
MLIKKIKRDIENIRIVIDKTDKMPSTSEKNVKNMKKSENRLPLQPVF